MLSNLYNSAFYREQGPGSLASARIILGALKDAYAFESALDIGCGLGTWLAAARELGAASVLGIDGHGVEASSLLIPKTCFRHADIASALDLGVKFDLALCMEVAEHVPHESVGEIVATLTRHADVVLFSAALPYQGGTGHVNENWLEYWTRRFAERSFEALDFLRWQVWHDERIDWWYRQNVVVFRRCGTPFLSSKGPPRAMLQSVVHPEMFLRSVRRMPTKSLRTTAAADLEYWSRITAVTPDDAVPPGYGREFSTDPVLALNASSFENLKDLKLSTLPPALADAIAPPAPARAAPPPLDRLEAAPSFIGIGVQNAATTWLVQMLRRHPRVYVAPGKELNFFNRRAFAPEAAYSGFGLTARVGHLVRDYVSDVASVDPAWLKFLAHIMDSKNNADWYETIFRAGGPRKDVKGEITPDYAMLPVSGFVEMLVVNPNVKIVLMLRHPLERAISHLGTIFDQAPAAAAFLADIAREPSVVNRGRYERILPRLEAVFAPEQLFIGFVDDIEADPAAFIARIAAFLELDTTAFAAAVPQSHIFARRQTLAIPDEVRAELDTAYGETLRFMAQAFPASCSAWT